MAASAATYAIPIIGPALGGIPYFKSRALSYVSSKTEKELEAIIGKSRPESPRYPALVPAHLAERHGAVVSPDNVVYLSDVKPKYKAKFRPTKEQYTGEIYFDKIDENDENDRKYYRGWHKQRLALPSWARTVKAA
jgi:hypothetical protein